MERNNCKSFILIFILLVSSFAAVAQEKGDSLSLTDAIIRVDGAIIYGKVTEINPTEIKYRMPGIPEGVVIILQRDQVYAISFSNHTTQVITPGFGTAGSAQKATVTGTVATSAEKEDTTRFNLSYKAAHGSLKIGLGFAREYTSNNGLDDFENTSNAPSIYISYQINVSRLIVTGISAGYANTTYTLNESNDYDGIAISKNIQESIITTGIYGRYDILQGYIKPYIMLGLNINYVESKVDGDLFFIDEGKHILSTSNLVGFKTNFIARAGLDLMITKRLGVYSDIGAGSNLVQVGVIFCFK